jgi:hypothetical protein
MKRTTIGLVSAALAIGGTVALAGPAHATPPTEGCPSNWERLYYPSLDPAYLVPAMVDSKDNAISFGHLPGNDNKYVCALPLGKPLPGGLQFYNFMDDSLQVG